MPASWEAYGVDGNQDGLADPYNPVDAIFAAARYLKAAGADKDIRAAVFAYNHADWYVDSVLLRAQVIGGLPANLVGSLTGLTEGRFPVAAKATYADEISKRGLQAPSGANAAVAVESTANRRGISIFADAGSPGRRGQRLARGQDRRAPSGSAASSRSRTRTATRTRTGAWRRSPSSTPRRSRRRSTRPRSSAMLALPEPRRQAEGRRLGHRPPRRQRAAARRPAEDDRRRAGEPRRRRPPSPPSRSACSRTRRAPNAAVAGGAQQEFLRTGRIDGALTPARALGLARDQIVIKQLKVGAQVPAGTVLGRIGKASVGQAPAPALRDPPGRPRRPADRPEADPRRLEAARVDRDLPRQGQEPVRRPGRRDAHDRPDPADEQGDADPARPRRPARPDLRVRPPATSRPARSTAACWPRSSSSSPPASTRR